MKVTGFTFIKDAIIYDYPVVEAIRSILPICTDFVVAVGRSNDATLDLIKNINPQKIKIIETVWEENMREGGRVLALETDKAFQAISEESDWAFYIQGDEVVHEKYLDTISNSMLKNKNNNAINGLLFNYLHFYGSYDYIGSSSKWYPHEIRIIKNNKSIYSYQDAQGFRMGDNKKLVVEPIDAYIYHYGWVKPPESMQRKQLNFNKYWHDDDWIENNIKKGQEFDYSQIDQLSTFQGTHPKVMLSRIKEKNWEFNYDLSYNQVPLKERLKGIAKRYLGLDFSYKNYIIHR